ncbi:hypothetical protein [Serratia sp. P2ACOL2]|uniref:hypothetical protein n=1 Tax=Serratia sp. P2ACOL2 TaxID=2482769 RepID=UPI001EE3B160|nr:hypothetical protein [Serratia sp. P2ACOL2]
MVIKTTDRFIAKTDAYELQVYKTEGGRLTAVKAYTSEEINRLTPEECRLALHVKKWWRF